MGMRKTKIVCTLGPATDRDGVLRELLLAGMDVARFNFSHGSHEEHKGRLDALKALREELHLPVAAMLDTKGPEIRLKTFAKGSVQLRTGLSNRDLLVRIYESLQAGRTVIVLLAGEDGGETQLQYALVTALSAEADTVSILRPGSGEETCSIEEFLAATRFETYDDMPITVKLGLTFGSWSRNTAIFAE